MIFLTVKFILHHSQDDLPKNTESKGFPLAWLFWLAAYQLDVINTNPFLEPCTWHEANYTHEKRLSLKKQ